MRTDCDEWVWLGDSDDWNDRTDVRVEADIDATGVVTLLSVRPFVIEGGRVKYKDCIMSSLSESQIGDLKESMMGHSED